jgi:hypothetical protein
VDVPLEERRFDFFRRGFFDTGIRLARIFLRHFAHHSSVIVPTQIVNHGMSTIAQLRSRAAM